MNAHAKLGLVFTLLGAFLFIGVTGYAGAVALAKGGQRNCLTETRVSPTSAEWEIILAPGEAYEAVMPIASFTFLPLGLECYWPLATGNAAVRTTSGSWSATAFDGVFVIMTAAGIALLVRRGRPVP